MTVQQRIQQSHAKQRVMLIEIKKVMHVVEKDIVMTFYM